MTATTATATEAIAGGAEPAELSRSERLSRDVLHALMIDSQPWKEIQANRSEVVRATFRELDPVDEFEGMLAAQMAIAHSIFLGASWLSLDRERPDRDRAFYLRQATRLMTLYRQHFSALRQCRRERGRKRRKPPARDLIGRQSALQEKTECARGEAREEAPPTHGNADRVAHPTAVCAKAPTNEFGVPERWPIHLQMPELSIAETGPSKSPTAQSRRRRMLESTGLQLAQGP